MKRKSENDNDHRDHNHKSLPSQSSSSSSSPLSGSTLTASELCALIDVQFMESSRQLSEVALASENQLSDNHMINVLIHLPPLQQIPTTLLVIIAEYSQRAYNSPWLKFIAIPRTNPTAIKRPEAFPLDPHTLNYKDLKRRVSDWVNYFDYRMVTPTDHVHIWQHIVCAYFESCNRAHPAPPRPSIIRQSFWNLRSDQLKVISMISKHEIESIWEATQLYRPRPTPTADAHGKPLNGSWTTVDYQRVLKWWKTMDEARTEFVEWPNSWTNYRRCGQSSNVIAHPNK